MHDGGDAAAADASIDAAADAVVVMNPAPTLYVHHHARQFALAKARSRRCRVDARRPPEAQLGVLSKCFWSLKHHLRLLYRLGAAL